MAPRSPISPAETEVLRYIAANGPISVGDLAAHFSVVRGHTRNTVNTFVDRLREKGHVTRRKIGGVYHYTARLGEKALLRSLVQDFVEGTLGGSLSPFVAYLAGRTKLSREDLDELAKLVEEMQREREAGEE